MRDSNRPPDPAAGLPEEALAAMRRAMSEYLVRPGDATELRTALRVISTEARARQLRAEQLIVALKQAWHSVPDVQHAATQQERDRLLDRLITVCIEEYYRG